MGDLRSIYITCVCSSLLIIQLFLFNLPIRTMRLTELRKIARNNVALIAHDSAGVGFTPHVISVKATFWNISALQNCWTRTLSVNRRVKYFIRGQVKATHFTLCSSPRIRLFSLLHHSNLPNVKGYCAGGDRRLLIYECVPVGSLEDRILENDDSNPGFRGWSYDQKSVRASYQRLCSNLLDDFCATAVVDGQIIGLGLLDTARLADFIKSWDRAAKKYTAIEVQSDYEKLGLANVWQESWNAIMGKMTRLNVSLIRYTSFSFCLCESLTYSPRSR